MKMFLFRLSVFQAFSDVVCVSRFLRVMLLLVVLFLVVFQIKFALATSLCHLLANYDSQVMPYTDLLPS